MRPASLSDAATVRALWREIDELHAGLAPAFFRGPRREGRSDAALRRALAEGSERLLVAEDARQVVRGLAHVLLYDTPAVDGLAPLRRAHLDSVVVEPGFRRGGCGRALVAATRAWAKQRGAAQLVLTLWEGNAAAERFYAALGLVRLSQVLGTDL